MPFTETDGLRYLTFESLAQAPVVAAVFTRQGGVSEGPHASLNVGALVGDKRDRVDENLERIFAAIGRPRNSLFDSWLVHSARALVADAPRPPEWERPPQADIVLTNNPHVTLFMRYADCVPIVYYDPGHHAIGLAHAGWRGSLLKVAARAVEAMGKAYGSKPQDLLVCLGPAICTKHYEVGDEVAEQVRQVYGDAADLFLSKLDGHAHLDLIGMNQDTLEQLGVNQLEIAPMCTYSESGDWFSHRASGGRTGRFGALIALD
ncbi:MAG: peptidoglycan editing factor PgeF [Anaerolineales bacterium]